MALTDYNTTASSNTTLNGVAVGASMAPTSTNDAIQQLMADLAQGLVQWPSGNGSAAAPAYSFGDDLNTGWYRIGADNVGLALGGVKRYDFSASELALESPSATDAGFSLTAPSTNDARVKMIRSGATSYEIVNEVGALRIKTGSSGATDDDTIATFVSGTWTLHSPNTGTTGTAFKVTTDQGGSDTEHFRVQTDGDVQNTNNSYGALSDISLKSGIETAASQWDDVSQLHLVNYNLKATGERHLGLIAQEVEEISPGLVTEADGLKGVKYSVLFVKMLGALQEAMDRIEDLEARLP